MNSSPMVTLFFVVLLFSNIQSLHIRNPNQHQFKLIHFASDAEKEVYDDLNSLDNEVKLIDNSLNQALLGSK